MTEFFSPNEAQNDTQTPAQNFAQNSEHTVREATAPEAGENAKSAHSGLNPEVFYKRQSQGGIITPNQQFSQTDVPAHIKDQTVLAEPILDRENGTQRGITCALDFSLADVEARMPNYFSGTPARSQLRDYLRENCPYLPADELYKVLNLAIGLENQAIEHYKNGLRHQKNISAGNAEAISKLATNSAQGRGSGLEFNKIFTRAEIRSMPIEDFRKNEKEIFAQYRAGLIK